MTAFHAHLAKRFTLNLVRAVLVLMVFVLMFHLPPPNPGLGAFLLVCLRILGLVLPSAFLVAALFTVGDLAHNHELMALKAAGWSLLKIMWPVILIAVVSVPLSAALPGSVPGPQPIPGSSAATRTAVHAGRAYPLSNLLAVFIGISLAATPRIKSTFVGFMGAALGLGAYFTVSATAQALGRHGGLPPVVSGWSPTVLFAGVALFLWRRADQ